MDGSPPGMGSSPRVRGRPQHSPVPHLRMGLIPAGAGQTCNSDSRESTRRAHPRGCGADRSSADSDAMMAGSSPRVRGRLLMRRVFSAHRRLIPAGAGQTSTRTNTHPPGVGSSPRVRGRRIDRLEGRLDSGLIPAGAGQTWKVRSVKRLCRAHPRGCGADFSSAAVSIIHAGSSPRVRGRRRRTVRLRRV